MAGDHLSNDDFFAQLTNLFEHNRNKSHGTVYLTQKRLTYAEVEIPSPTKIVDDPLWDLHPEKPLPVLIRASNNKSSKRSGTDRPGTDRDNVEKIKLSTVVQPDKLDAFYARYAEACKSGMSGLKKRDRKKGKKDKKKKKAIPGETKG
ncbi:signal recognition particle, SRP9/SRP14 subunit [Melanomma pulvis-pyrius CBS 109.77]|uniref:Signal recognition particle subunit SRP14 n=1 Tax=Melanomma pulvis-pyrius CBS 109.77 TaxID=1314802 RepID=A0A6A6XUK5_9PLEO|nr:signal recognition particle, SRP9/SRP14 subunit [Melanomma pulvis-pyrius CBS 109.77]